MTKFTIIPTYNEEIKDDEPNVEFALIELREGVLQLIARNSGHCSRRLLTIREDGVINHSGVRIKGLNMDYKGKLIID